MTDQIVSTLQQSLRGRVIGPSDADYDAARALYNGMMKDTTVMATFEPSDSKMNELVVSPRDILFECPSCGKNLVVDEAAQGLIIDCPQCHISVIVPPKS